MKEKDNNLLKIAVEQLDCAVKMLAMYIGQTEYEVKPIEPVEQREEISIAKIQHPYVDKETVLAYLKERFPNQDVAAQSRKSSLVFTRHIYCYMLKRFSQISLIEILLKPNQPIPPHTTLI